MLQCLWESFALPVIVNPLVSALEAKQAQPSEQNSGEFPCVALQASTAFDSYTQSQSWALHVSGGL